MKEETFTSYGSPNRRHGFVFTRINILSIDLVRASVMKVDTVSVYMWSHFQRSTPTHRDTVGVFLTITKSKKIGIILKRVYSEGAHLLISLM